jgi:hypothetical protein
MTLDHTALKIDSYVYFFVTIIFKYFYAENDLATFSVSYIGDKW